MSEKKSTLMQKVQRFGGAMFTPVLFFAVFGIIVGFATLFKNNLVFGSLADPETTWYKVWDIIYNGANTVFKQMPLIFAIGLPVSLAKKQQARACLEIFVIYATFLYLTSSILQYWGPVFGVDFESVERTSGLATIASVQSFLASTGVFGVGMYTFLERLMIPFGLHHFIYAPFLYDSAIVDGGIKAYWVAHLSEFASMKGSLAAMFPAGGFALTGMSKMFAPLGISGAIYVTAKPNKKKKVLALLIPVLITAMFTGITEPLEFTFLFIAPVLYLCHAVLAGLMSAITFACGISGDFSLGLIQNASLNWVPLWSTHGGSYVLQIVIGLIFSAIYFVLFRALILKMNLKTPGREADDEESKLYTKKEYKAKKENSSDNKYQIAAEVYMEGLGGKENIIDVTNCATRLRVSVKDVDKVLPDAYFKENGAHGVVRNGTALQVIVGLSVPNVREEFEKLL